MFLVLILTNLLSLPRWKGYSYLIIFPWSTGIDFLCCVQRSSVILYLILSHTHVHLTVFTGLKYFLFSDLCLGLPPPAPHTHTHLFNYILQGLTQWQLGGQWILSLCKYPFLPYLTYRYFFFYSYMPSLKHKFSLKKLSIKLHHLCLFNFNLSDHCLKTKKCLIKLPMCAT